MHPNGVSLRLGGDRALTARLVLDCMGHGSPAVRQLRWGQKPDGICLVVGTMAGGYANNTTADVIYTAADVVEGSYRQVTQGRRCKHLRATNFHRLASVLEPAALAPSSSAPARGRLAL